MKITLKLAAWFLVLATVRGSDAQFLKAIAEVETGNKPDAIGQHGEVSAYQIMPDTWARYTDEPLSSAKNRAIAYYVAKRHLNWCRRQLLIARDDCRSYPEQLNNPYLLALAWHCGPHGTRGLTKAKIDYATRVYNLYMELRYGDSFGSR